MSVISKELTFWQPDFYLIFSNDGVSSLQSINDTKLSSLSDSHTQRNSNAPVRVGVCVFSMTWELTEDITAMQTWYPLCKVFFGYTTKEPIPFYPTRTHLPTWDKPNPLRDLPFSSGWLSKGIFLNKDGSLKRNSNVISQGDTFFTRTTLPRHHKQPESPPSGSSRSVEGSAGSRQSCQFESDILGANPTSIT